MGIPFELREIVASMLRIEPAEVGPQFDLRAFTSLGRANLDSVVRKQFGKKVLEVYTAKFFIDLERAVLGQEYSGHAPSEDSSKQVQISRSLNSGSRSSAADRARRCRPV